MKIKALLADKKFLVASFGDGGYSVIVNSPDELWDMLTGSRIPDPQDWADRSIRTILEDLADSDSFNGPFHSHADFEDGRIEITEITK